MVAYFSWAIRLLLRQREVWCKHTSDYPSRQAHGAGQTEFAFCGGADESPGLSALLVISTLGVANRSWESWHWFPIGLECVLTAPLQAKSRPEANRANFSPTLPSVLDRPRNLLNFLFFDC